MMSIPEMNNLASCYEFEVKGVPGKGVYLIDRYKGRYMRICSKDEVRTYVKDDLMVLIHKFAEKLRPKQSRKTYND